MLIIFEGTEGCGKTTQIKLLQEWLTRLGEKVKITREPGGTEVGEAIRDILLTPSLKPSPIAELLLYVADRAQHIQEIISTKSKDEWILCDRFIYSTIAYQGYGRELPLEVISDLNNIAIGKTKPDLVFWLDVNPEIGLERKRVWKWDRIEKEKITFHKKVREGYLDVYENSPPGLIYKINGELSKDEVHQRIKEIVLRNWKKNLV